MSDGKEIVETAGESGVSQFKEGDKVLAYHGPLIYEAKIQRAELQKNEWKYLVHYLGWSKNWDEWIGKDRLLPPTDENLELQKSLFKDKNGDKRMKGRISQGKQKGVKGRKRKSETGIEPSSQEKDGEDTDHVIVKLALPVALKKRLADDWEFVTQQGKLVKLPRNPNVEDILKRYWDTKAKRENVSAADSLSEVLNGLRAYFDKALPLLLLYKEEREQYSRLFSDNSGLTPSLIYGAEHLLRLFVKLPELLGYANLEEESLAQLQQKLVDLLKFIQKNLSNFLLPSYDA